MEKKNKRLRGTGRQESAAASSRLAGVGLGRCRCWVKALPLQQEFESLRRFADGYGLTPERLARMARALERDPAGEKKGVVEALRVLAEQRRIPLGRLTILAETLVYEPELERQLAFWEQAAHRAAGI